METLIHTFFEVIIIGLMLCLLVCVVGMLICLSKPIIKQFKNK